MRSETDKPLFYISDCILHRIMIPPEGLVVTRRKCFTINDVHRHIQYKAQKQPRGDPLLGAV